MANEHDKALRDGRTDIGKDAGIVLPTICRECGYKSVDRVFATTRPEGAMCLSCKGTNVGIDPDSWIGAELAVLLRNVLGICD